MTASWSPLIIICYSPFLGTFIPLARFHYVSIFHRSILFLNVMLLNAFFYLRVWIIWILVLVSNLFGRDLQILRWLMFCILQVFITCRDNCYLMCVWCVTRFFYLRMFCILQYVVCISLVRDETLMHLFVPNI